MFDIIGSINNNPHTVGFVLEVNIQYATLKLRPIGVFTFALFINLLNQTITSICVLIQEEEAHRLVFLYAHRDKRATESAGVLYICVCVFYIVCGGSNVRDF